MAAADSESTQNPCNATAMCPTAMLSLRIILGHGKRVTCRGVVLGNTPGGGLIERAALLSWAVFSLFDLGGHRRVGSPLRRRASSVSWIQRRRSRHRVKPGSSASATDDGRAMFAATKRRSSISGG